MRKTGKHSYSGVLKVLGTLMLIMVLWMVFFDLFASNEAKKDFYTTTGLDHPALVDHEVYVDLSGECHRAIIGNSWLAKVNLTNTHPNRTFSEIMIRFNFSDGYENEKLSEILLPYNQGDEKTLTVSIKGHTDALFESMEVVEVR